MLDFAHGDLDEAFGPEDDGTALLSELLESRKTSTKVGRFQPISDILDRCVAKTHRLEARVRATAHV